MPIARDYSYTIGRTPLVRINRICDGAPATVLGKVEGRNPSFSVKCRIGAAMIWRAEEEGRLRPGGRIIEPTSGNTGIALAYVAAARGYRLSVTMPSSMSLERRQVLGLLGAEVVLTPPELGMKGAVAKAEEMTAADPSAFMPQQFKNPANPEIHFRTTGPEIWADTEGTIDVLVSGVGTGGTISGVSRYIKLERGKAITSVAVEPEESAVITQRLAGEEPRPSPHKIQGIGAGFIPDTLDLAMVDRVERASGPASIAMARRLSMEEGILCGISSGAAMAVAERLARDPAFAGKTIVAVLPDALERYLTSPLVEGLFDEAGLVI